MPTSKRRFEPSVIARLFEQPYRFQFFQAVRLLELWLKRNGMAHEATATHLLRFQNSLSLNFPASQIEALQTEPRELPREAGALSAAVQGGQLKYIRMTPAFMGLLGTAGALPAHYTERIAAHQLYEKDEGPRAFLDTFSNRALSLFYEAWRKYRLELSHQIVGKDRFLPVLLSLAGIGHETLQKRFIDDGVLDESLAYFAASLRRQPASAVVIGRVLSEYFGQCVKVTQFVGSFHEVAPIHRSKLGGANAMLGSTALLGERIWLRDVRLGVSIGALDHAHFEAFLPGAKAARAVMQILSMFTDITFEYEVQLVLLAADVQGISLASQRSGGRLGWDSFLLTGAQVENRADVRYLIHPMRSST